MAGSFGNGSSGNQVCQWVSTLIRFGTTPQAFTATRTSVGRGSGTGTCSSFIGSPTLWSRAASMVVTHTSSLLTPRPCARQAGHSVV